MPFAVIRGYHRHYRAQRNASLPRPVVDIENGFLITPMERGIRVTTGVEFADRDAPPTPVQLDRALPLARELFPLAEPVDFEPWLGRRPCLPDSLPVIGPAPRHPGLFLDFGHNHLGFTLGPVTGRLAAEMIVGEALRRSAAVLADPVFERVTCRVGKAKRAHRHATVGTLRFAHPTLRTVLSMSARDRPAPASPRRSPARSRAPSPSPRRCRSRRGQEAGWRARYGRWRW